ncbi:MAG: aldose 1-epimerase [Hyphomicrobiales bacterium]|nr:MAG: aldose 1-epimerase [Hyphomicrobiales bacterium]
MRLAAGQLTLDLAPELGGSIAAFEHAGVALMRPMSPPAGSAPHALHSGMFPMVPFANSLRDNRFAIGGQAYEVAPNMTGARLNYHGSGWQRPWQVTESQPDRCTLQLDETEEAPGYRFAATQRFILSPGRLEVSIAVTNRSAQPMPFGIGLHPWFPRHGDALATFAASQVLREDADFQALSLAPIPADQDYAAGREPPRAYQNRCYAGWTGSARIDWPSRRLALGITADPLFQHLMFHVPSHDFDTFCLEPQSNRTSAFDGVESGTPAPGVHILAPGETLGGRVIFTVHS